MDERLLALRAKLKEQKAANETRGSGGGDKRFYRFFDIPVDGSCTLRFLPDGNEKNAFFYKEKQMFSWEYADPDRPGQTVRINMPCRNMYEPRTCPVSQLISKQYETNDTAKKMWVNKKYIYQGFVRKSDLEEAEVPENPIRLHELTKKLHGRITGALEDESEETGLPSYPVNYDNGLNFIIKKTKQGEHANYDSSQFSQKQTPLTEDEITAIEQFGLYDLNELLPPQPSEEQFALQVEMANALLDGEPWNKEWETLWKPYRPTNKEDGGDHETPAARPSTKASAKSDDEGEATAKPAVGANAQSILDRLNKAKAAAAAKTED